MRFAKNSMENLNRASTSILLCLVFTVIVGATVGDNNENSNVPRGRHHAYKKYTNFTLQMGAVSNENLIEYQKLLNKNNSEIEPQSRSFDFVGAAKLPESCQFLRKQCDRRSPYRTMDGTCNNLRRPFWGASFTFFNRLHSKPFYNDGYNSPRGGIISSLPNPRRISTTIHPDLILPDQALTNFVPQIGQFLDHDLTLAPESDLECCGKDKYNIDCWPIAIPSNDPFYSQHNQSCLSFTRSTPFCFPNNYGVRSQMNSLTAFVDASQLYGSDPKRANQLREGKGGRMLSSPGNPRFLPTVAQVELRTREKLETMGTYAAGDDRVNEMPALTVMHTLLFREHNRLANEIMQARPRFTDEQAFQAARRLLIAEWQNIVYGEYLPIILGPTVMAQYEISVQPAGFSQYDPRVDPTIFHAFATAAYRFGHSMINGVIRLMKDLKEFGSYQIRNGFFNDSHIRRNSGQGYDLILGGLMQQNAQTYDRHVTEDLTNFLLRDPSEKFGSDLLARNVQRGRDHGLPGYHEFRKFCNLPSMTTWRNVPPQFDQVTWSKLNELYKSPADIDLFTGGLAEIPLPGAVTGPTFNCLKAHQFQRLKFGDRFFFTHRSQTGSFNLEQISQIKRVTLGDLICLNSQIQRTPANVFKLVSPSNPWVNCSDVQRRQFLKVTNFL